MASEPADRTGLSACPEALASFGEGALDVVLPIGSDMVTIHRAEPGFWIGESAILARAPRFMTIVAASKSRVFCLAAAAMLRLLQEQPQFCFCFFELAHLNGSRAVATVAELLSRSPEARLAQMLNRLAGETGETQVTQTDLAALLGTTRSSLQRALGILVECEAVSTGYGSIQIIDRAKLQKVIDNG
jgi:CRP-like cAMP-binding protein